MAKILAFPIAAVLFAVWAVYLGGLASLQSTCADNGTSNMVGVPSIDATLPCMKVYRLQWFYAAYEFFLVVVTALVAIPKLGGHLNMGVIGLLAVGVVLFIDASNTFLSAEELDFYSSGQPLHRIRTTTAGAIMVAVANGLAMLALGHTRTIETTTVEKPASNV